MIDIDIKNEFGKFKLRTSGVITKNNKVLVQKAKRFNGYVYPGGHIELGELSKEAILREIKEEVNIEVKINNLICVLENIYNGKNNEICQEINYYYNLEPIDNIETKEFTITENDKGIIKTQEFYWIDKKELVKNNVMPLKISELLEKGNDNNIILEIDERIKN